MNVNLPVGINRMEVRYFGDSSDCSSIFSTDRMDRVHDVGGVVWMIFGLYIIM